MQQQRLHELLIEQVTRAVPVAVGIPRNPSPDRHGASPCRQTCSQHEQISDPSPKYECKRSIRGWRVENVREASLVLATISCGSKQVTNGFASAPESLYGSKLSWALV